MTIVCYPRFHTFVTKELQKKSNNKLCLIEMCYFFFVQPYSLCDQFAPSPACKSHKMYCHIFWNIYSVTVARSPPFLCIKYFSVRSWWTEHFVLNISPLTKKKSLGVKSGDYGCFGVGPTKAERRLCCRRLKLRRACVSSSGHIWNKVQSLGPWKPICLQSRTDEQAYPSMTVQVLVRNLSYLR